MKKRRNATDNIQSVNSGQSRDSSLKSVRDRVQVALRVESVVYLKQKQQCFQGLVRSVACLFFFVWLLLLLLSLSAALAGHQADRKTDRKTDSRIDETSERNSLKLRLVLSQFRQSA